MNGTGICKKVIVMVTTLVITVTLLFPGTLANAAYPLLREGSSGNAVSRLQQELKNQGFYNYNVTGYYGPVTREMVIRFQRARGLKVDGIAGNQTQSVLYGSASAQSSNNSYTTLKFGMSGQAVSNLQSSLKQKGFFNGNVTGYYGKVTENSVIAFQKAYGLRIDGIAGPQTLGTLYGSSNNTMAAVSRSSQTSRDRDHIYWLARIIHAESEGESYNGKVAVGSVIMNRVKSPDFPNTVYNVIFEYYGNIPQFSPVAEGTIYNNPNSESMKAAEAAFYGAKPVGNALYFFNPSKAAGTWIWNNRKYITTIGSHAFFQ